MFLPSASGARSSVFFWRFLSDKSDDAFHKIGNNRVPALLVTIAFHVAAVVFLLAHITSTGAANGRAGTAAITYVSAMDSLELPANEPNDDARAESKTADSLQIDATPIAKSSQLAEWRAVPLPAAIAGSTAAKQSREGGSRSYAGATVPTPSSLFDDRQPSDVKVNDRPRAQAKRVTTVDETALAVLRISLNPSKLTNLPRILLTLDIDALGKIERISNISPSLDSKVVRRLDTQLFGYRLCKTGPGEVTISIEM